MKSCFFIGHREATEELMPCLLTIVESLVAQDVTEFIVGHYGGFDRIATSAVRKIKSLYPHITLTMLLPYHPAERSIPLPTGFDGSFYPPGMENIPRQLAILRANQYMVDHTDVLVAYVWHPASNAWNLLEYARKKGHGLVIQIDRYGCV